ncbi:unnamed protein product, partial [Mesorhabditis spiculigera]
MPGFIGKKLCPELEIVRGDYKKYGAESRVFSGIFEEYDPELSMGSLDEAYLDITEYVAERAVPIKRIARNVRRSDGSCRIKWSLGSGVKRSCERSGTVLIKQLG